MQASKNPTAVDETTAGAGAGGDWFGPMPRLFRMMLTSRFVGQRRAGYVAERRKENLVVLREPIEAGDVTSVLDRRCALHEVPDALRYQGEGHTQGKTVIVV